MTVAITMANHENTSAVNHCLIVVYLRSSCTIDL